MNTKIEKQDTKSDFIIIITNVLFFKCRAYISRQFVYLNKVPLFCDK